MFGILGFVAFVIAGILELVKTHIGAVIWLVIIGGLLVSAEVAWGWYGTRSRARAPRTPV